MFLIKLDQYQGVELLRVERDPMPHIRALVYEVKLLRKATAILAENDAQWQAALRQAASELAKEQECQKGGQ